jgi:hypothetical protein
MHHKVNEADMVMIYSNAQKIVLQLRHEVPTETDVLAPAFKAPIALSPTDAIAIAGYLLSAAQQCMHATMHTTAPPPSRPAKQPTPIKATPSATKKKKRGKKEAAKVAASEPASLQDAR